MKRFDTRTARDSSLRNTSSSLCKIVSAAGGAIRFRWISSGLFATSSQLRCARLGRF